MLGLSPSSPLPSTKRLHPTVQGAEDIGDHEGGHCMDCASVAAVGAAAAAAANAAGEGNEGDLGGEAGAYTNPYACMLTPEKIQALEAHKNSAVAKRLGLGFEIRTASPSMLYERRSTRTAANHQK